MLTPGRPRRRRQRHGPRRPLADEGVVGAAVVARRVPPVAEDVAVAEGLHDGEGALVAAALAAGGRPGPAAEPALEPREVRQGGGRHRRERLPTGKHDFTAAFYNV